MANMLLIEGLFLSNLFISQGKESKELEVRKDVKYS
jgi:hypothetical protein